MKLITWRTIQTHPTPAFGRCSEGKIKALVRAKLLVLKRTAAGQVWCYDVDLDRAAQRWEEGLQSARDNEIKPAGKAVEGRISVGLVLAGLYQMRPRCGPAVAANAAANARQGDLFAAMASGVRYERT